MTRFGGNCQMGNMTNACESLSAKAICGYSLKVFKLLQFGCGKSFTQDGQVLLLLMLCKPEQPKNS